MPDDLETFLQLCTSPTTSTLPGDSPPWTRLSSSSSPGISVDRPKVCASIILRDQWRVMRSYNSMVTVRNGGAAKLIPLSTPPPAIGNKPAPGSPFGPPPSAFPRTPLELANMSRWQLMAVLQAYGESTDGSVDDMRDKLACFIGTLALES